MARPGVGSTALGAATCRLIEQYQPERSRLITDPVVKDMVGGTIRTLMRFPFMRSYTLRRTEGILQGLYGSQVCRTRFLDEAVATAIAGGVNQMVILGAGLDTRPYRLAGLAKARVVELDLPSVQEAKRKRLAGRFGRIPENVALVPADLNVQELGDVLRGTPFDNSKPAVFLWEGVTQYIPAEAVSRTLAFFGRSAGGSTVLFTYVLKGVVERRSGIPDSNRMMDTVAKNGAPWIFGLELPAVPSLLKEFNLQVVADVGNADYQRMYLAPIGRNLVVSEVERTVQATVARPSR